MFAHEQPPPKGLPNFITAFDVYCARETANELAPPPLSSHVPPFRFRYYRESSWHSNNIVTRGIRNDRAFLIHRTLRVTNIHVIGLIRMRLCPAEIWRLFDHVAYITMFVSE